MKKARMNISHSRFILFKLKIFGEIVTTQKVTGTLHIFILGVSVFTKRAVNLIQQNEFEIQLRKKPNTIISTAHR